MKKSGLFGAPKQKLPNDLRSRLFYTCPGRTKNQGFLDAVKRQRDIHLRLHVMAYARVSRCVRQTFNNRKHR